MKVAIGCDHAAYEFKSKIVAHLRSKDIEVQDFGAHSSANACDYPDIAFPVCHSVASGENELGILICGTGIGMSMAANKVKGIRCALCSETFSAKATREHNDANVLAMGERVLGIGLALEVVDAFIATQFSNAERHVRRIKKMMAAENE